MRGNVWLPVHQAVTCFCAASGAVRTWATVYLAGCALGPCSACVLYVENIEGTRCARRALVTRTLVFR